MNLRTTRARRLGISSLALAMSLAWIVALPQVALAAPVNDDPEDATVIGELPFEDTLDTTDATQAPNEPDACSFGQTVWYEFTPSENTRIVADTFGSEYSAPIAIFEGAPSEESLFLCGGNRHSFEAEAGTTYTFKTGGGSGVLQFSLAVAAPPPNDDISSPTVIPRLPFQDSLDTNEATLDLDDPSCFGRAKSVWYSFRNSRKARKIGLRAGGTYDTTISIYTRSGGRLNQIACTDDSRVRFPAKAEKSYLIMIGSFENGPGGLLTFRARAFEEPPPPPAPLRLRLRVASRGEVSAVTGTARIHGEMRCTRTVRVSLFATLRQKIGDRVASDSISKRFSCRKGRTRRWSARFAASRPFRAGDAGVFLTARAEKRTKEVAKIVRLVRCRRCL